MMRQDYHDYEYRNRSTRVYVRRLIGVLFISLLLGGAVVIVSLVVGYYRLKPLQGIYIWQYLTSARRSSRSETGVSDYRLLVRVVPEPDGKTEASDPSKSKLKGKRGGKNKPEPEEDKREYLLCNDNQVEPVYVNGEQVRTAEGDLAFRLRKEAPNEKLVWQALTVKDLEMRTKFGSYIYDGESVDALMRKPRNYGILMFAISLIVGFVVTTRKRFQLNIREEIRDEIREIRQLEVVGFVVTKIEILKGWISAGKAAASDSNRAALQVIESKSLTIPARELTPVERQKEPVVRQIKPVEQALFLSEAEQSEEEGGGKFGLEIFGEEDKGER